MRALKIMRIIEGGEMDLVPLVQLLEGPEGTNLSAAICGVEEERADPKNLHYWGLTPSPV